METFGKYQMIRRLGQGGMAEVWLAKEPLAAGLNKILVIKKIHPSLAEAPQFRQMFEDEAKVAVNLNHPSIVQTFSYGQIGPTYYLAMEHVEGVDLLALLNFAVEKRQQIPFGLCAYIGQQVAKGLDYAHRKADETGEPLGIVHRDISPQNILVSVDGSVKIFDFGIARAKHVREDEGVVKGKFAYMSPEQAEGRAVDGRSDIFSTGIVLWELCVGKTLFGHLKAGQARNAIRAAQVPPPRELVPEMPTELENIILKALAKRPEDRFATARDLHRALGLFMYEAGAKAGELYESGSLARLVAQLVPANRPPADVTRATTGSSGGTPATPVQSSRPLVTAEATQVSAGEPSSLPVTERRHVVAVVGVLDGLAALRREVGENRSREALLDFLRVCEHVAYKHGAHTDRLDERGFFFLFGLAAGEEDDTSRAVHLAAALREALDGICRELDKNARLDLHVGVQRGTALVTRAMEGGKLEYEVVGRTRAIGEKLAQEAMAGEVLVGGGVFRGARVDWNFEELPPIDIPGITPDGTDGSLPGDTRDGYEPTESRGIARAKVYRLLAARPRTERLAEPPSARSLIGRDGELATLRTLYKQAVDDQAARHVLVLGEVGIGKRTIVEAFRKELDPATHLTLRAVARPSLRDTPYALVADLNRDLMGLPEDANPRQVQRRVAELVARLFRPEEKESQQVHDAFCLLLGVKTPGPGELEPGERRHRLQQAMRATESRLADGRTLVVCIEDLHWADQQSFDIILGLVADPLGRPVFGIATARPELMLGEKLTELARMQHVAPMLLAELSPEARRQLVLARFEEGADCEPLVQRILERAGGNPFYINELIDSLTERGVLTPTESSRPSPSPDGAMKGDNGHLRWSRRDEDLAVPTTVEAVVASRIDRLADDERDTIRRAALLGTTFRVEDLLALSGRDPLPALARLAGRGLIAPSSGSGDLFHAGPAGYVFRNSITREVAYGGLAPDSRALLHSIAADRLRRSVAYRPGADDAALAEHLERAGDRPAAGRALLSAGLYARDNAGNLEAWRLLERALTLLPSEAHAERYRVHGEREQILRGLGKRPAQLREVHAMRKAAAATGDARLEIEAQTRLGLLYLDAGKHAAARRELDQALKLAREHGDALVESEALRLQALLMTNIGRNIDAQTLAEQALAAAERMPPSTDENAERARLVARAQASSALGNVLVHTGRLRDSVPRFAEALVTYRRLALRHKESATLNNMGWVFVGLGEYEEALEHYKRSLMIAQDLGDRASIGVKLANIGQTYLDLGDLPRARRYLDKALELHRALGDVGGMADTIISLGQVDLREHHVARAAEAFERGLELAGQGRNRYQEIRALVYLAFAQIARGDQPDGALELARSATRLAREGGIANGEAYGLGAEVLALIRRGEGAAALEQAKKAVALVDSGREIDSPERILHIASQAAAAAGDDHTRRELVGRAFVEVQRKTRQLHDPKWREQYLASDPAHVIVAEASAAGLQFLASTPGRSHPRERTTEGGDHD
jgi:serine/threonine protein kinase/predicted ATPase